MRALPFAVTSLAILFGCVEHLDPADGTRVVERAVSPSGCCKAEIVEFTTEAAGGPLTQVLVDLGGCGGGATGARGTGLGLRMRWVDDSQLEITGPSDLELSHTQADKIVQCWDRKVRIVLLQADQYPVSPGASSSPQPN